MAQQAHYLPFIIAHFSTEHQTGVAPTVIRHTTALGCSRLATLGLWQLLGQAYTRVSIKHCARHRSVVCRALMLVCENTRPSCERI